MQNAGFGDIKYCGGVFLVLVGVIALTACDKKTGELNENIINTALSFALSDIKNVPEYACVKLPEPGGKLPGYTETATLMTFSGNVRDDVVALIDAGLITVNFNSGKGQSALATFKIKSFIKLNSFPDVPLSYVELTKFGREFYRYDDTSSDENTKGLYGLNRFCSYIQYGGVERFMTPQKNPFDDNPHLVSWVNFKWKPDEHKTPWLGNPVLKDEIAIGRSKDSWSRSGILLELSDDEWRLGDEPYTIRW